MRSRRESLDQSWHYVVRDQDFIPNRDSFFRRAPCLFLGFTMLEGAPSLARLGVAATNQPPSGATTGYPSAARGALAR
jgi:hypothetical protein